MYTDYPDSYYAVKNFINSKTTLDVPGGFPYIYLYWNKLNDDGSTTKIALGSGEKSRNYGGTWADGAKLI